MGQAIRGTLKVATSGSLLGACVALLWPHGSLMAQSNAPRLRAPVVLSLKLNDRPEQYADSVKTMFLVHDAEGWSLVIVGARLASDKTAPACTVRSAERAALFEIQRIILDEAAGVACVGVGVLRGVTVGLDDARNGTTLTLGTERR